MNSRFSKFNMERFEWITMQSICPENLQLAMDIVLVNFDLDKKVDDIVYLIINLLVGFWFTSLFGWKYSCYNKLNNFMERWGDAQVGTDRYKLLKFTAQNCTEQSYVRLVSLMTMGLSVELFMRVFLEGISSYSTIENLKKIAEMFDEQSNKKVEDTTYLNHIERNGIPDDLKFKQINLQNKINNSIKLVVTGGST
eukprot:CAMPEP_0116977520 /NCGR_PEP_ID=MMETSP0467-20121206/57189_1 /TAXON_ID=283647 /ORGANISM="Mesodinium pulex, Strain SPMC105" /LENGTH=195 /DNA_ID=CAMNT_0004670623 /DNA_START=74 /DNA_END=661 /DNA_ORIENTATION=-